MTSEAKVDPWLCDRLEVAGSSAVGEPRSDSKP